MAVGSNPTGGLVHLKRGSKRDVISQEKKNSIRLRKAIWISYSTATEAFFQNLVRTLLCGVRLGPRSLCQYTKDPGKPKQRPEKTRNLLYYRE